MSIDDMSKQIEEAVKERPGENLANLLSSAAVSSIPVIGAALGSLFSSLSSEIEVRRILHLFRVIDQEMRTLDESKVDNSFLDSEDFYDLMYKVVDQGRRTRSQEKRILYAKILRSRVSSAAASTETAEDYLNIVTELTEKEVLIASVLYDRITNGPEPTGDKKHAWASREGLEDLYTEGVIPEADYEYVLLRLQRIGLFKEFTGGLIAYDTQSNPYNMTDTFKELMSSIASASSHS